MTESSFKLCGCFKRHFNLRRLTPTEDVKRVFAKYSENGVMTAEKLKLFLEAEQGEEHVSVEEAHKRIQSQHGLLGKLTHMTLDQFLLYLLDVNQNPAIVGKVHHDMTAPVSHYYIYTGHNSYLTGNQLSSDCSEVPIIDALKKGVRVIELDLWANSAGDKIQVLHGKTLTTPVDFEKCIVAIRDNAFVASDYGLVITFEDHLTTDLQVKAAEIVTRVLGSLLLYPDEKEEFLEFKSPEELKGRIIISTKPPREYLAGKKTDQNVKPAVAEGENGKDKQDLPARPTEGEWGEELPSFSATIDGAETEEEQEKDGTVEPQIEHAPHPAYAKLIMIQAGKPKGVSLADALAVDKNVKRVSLSEPQLEKIAKDGSAVIVKFTQRNLLRIYPYGLRVNSSNYNPLVAWTHGAQMVAFNMQGYGRPLWLVHGFFRANGNCGYVKKPSFLLPGGNNGKFFDPRTSLPVKMTLKVKVLLGLGWLEKFGKHHFDNFSPPDFYARVGIAGLEADTVMKKTRSIEDEWLPKWESEFQFPLTVPELALLRVEVHEYDMSDKDDFGGQNCLPVAELKRGFRVVPLFDKKGQELTGVRLLMHFEFVTS